MSEQNIQAVEAYIYSLKEKDLSRAPFADDLLFIDPIIGEIRGAEEARKFLSNFLPTINDVRIHKHFTDGDYVATRWEVDATFGVIQIFEQFKVVDGKITEAIACFDPRPITNPA
jgi:limonene-1,2-epoxide hydrolase